MSNVELVKTYLRAQNMEQLGRIDEAIDLYEDAVAAGFDAVGPYDRLIALYSNQARHPDVIRIVDIALVQVHTYADKRSWYEQMRGEARRALGNVPRAAPKDA